MVTQVSPRRAVGRRLAGSDAAPIVVPAALSAVLSLIALTARSLGFDEGATVAIASQHGHALGSAIAHDGGNMAGYYLLEHVLIGEFGDGLAVLRLPSVVATVATVALVGAIALRLFDRRVAWVAALLSALSLPLVFWAQTARGYALVVAFTCAGMLAFVALCDRPGRGRSWMWAAAAYAVAMALACYCSFVAVLVVPVQLLALIHRPRAARRYLAALAGLAACCIPLAILAIRRGSDQLFWVPRPTRQVETQVLQSLTSTGLQPSFHRVFTTTAGVVITCLALIAIGVAVLRARRARRARGRAAAGDPLASWGAALALAWVAIPGALTFVYSFVSQPVFEPRNLLVSVPAVGLVLAVGICDRRLPARAAAAALIVAVALRAIPLVASYGVSPEPWRAATADVLAHARPGDCIALYPQDARNAFRYYAGAHPPRAILPAVGWGDARPFVERYATLSPAQIAALRPGCRRVWLVTSHEGQRNGPPQARANRARWHGLRRNLAATFGHGRVRTYGWAAPVHVQLLPGRVARHGRAQAVSAITAAARARRTSARSAPPAAIRWRTR